MRALFTQSHPSYFFLLIFTLIIAPSSVWAKNIKHMNKHMNAPFRVGFITPLTGPRSSIGQDAQRGARLALRHLYGANSQSVANLEIIFEDSQGHPAHGMTAYRKLHAQGIKFVITQNSNVSIPISRSANNDGVIQLAISTTSDEYSTPNDLTFRLNGTTENEAQHLVDYISSRTSKVPGNIAVITMEDEYPLRLQKNVLQQFAQRNIKIAFEETFLPQELDYRTIITKLKSINTKYVILLAYQTQAGLFVKQQKQLGLTPDVIMTSTPVNNQEFFDTAGKASEGTLVTYIRPNMDHHAAAKYKIEYGHDVNLFSSHGYDAVLIAHRALRKCNFTPDTICLKNALFSIKNFEGLSGKKSFDDTFGDMEDNYSILIATDGKFVPIQ